MEELTLSNGQKVTYEQIRDYFALVMEAEQSGEQFPVDLDDVYLLAYGRKADAKRALVSNTELFAGADYHIRNAADVVVRAQGGGSQPEKIYLTVSCLEYLIARKVRPIFEIYRQCRQAVFEQRRLARMPSHIRRYVAN